MPGVGAVAVAAALAACSGGASDTQRWSALPHTMGCDFLPNDTAADPPGSTVVKQVTLSHDGGSRLKLEALFRSRVPPEPRVQNGRFGPIDAPGSIYTSFLIQPHGLPDEKVIEVSSPSPSVNQGWSGDVSEFDGADPEVLASVSADGNQLTMILNLDGQDAVFGNGVFKADVDVVQIVAGQPSAAGGPNLFPVRSPRCVWDTPAATSAAVAPADTPTAPSSSVVPQAPSSIPIPGADAHGFLDQPGARCDDADTVQVAARTTQSTLVICRDTDGFVYRGSRLSDGASIELPNAVPSDDGFDVANPQNGTRYEVRSSALTIRVSGEDFVEPVTEFWSAAAATTIPNPGYSTAQLVRTTSGQVRCQVEFGEVVCERASIDGFPQAPASETGGHWNLAAVTSGGEYRWSIGNLGDAHPDTDIILDYGTTRRINGWLVEASSDGTRFTHDGSGHGMFVSINDVHSF